MVSIHRILIVLYMTIRVLCFVFRFKCGADFVYLPGGCGKALKKINDIQYPTPV